MKDFFHAVEHPPEMPITIHSQRSGSGVSRCSLCYIYKPFYRPSGGVRRSNKQCGWGVGYKEGLGCLESQRLDGCAGVVAGILSYIDAVAGL